MYAVLSENDFLPSTSGINIEFKETQFAGKRMTLLFLCFLPTVCRGVSGSHEVEVMK
jgi:hypothetical protein